MSFLHGVEIVEIDTGPRPIRTVRSSVIGVVGTAHDAEASAFPANTPVLIAANQQEAAKLGNSGTLPKAITAIFNQIGAMVVVVRVDEGATEADTISNIIGGVGDDGQYTGLSALFGAECVVHVAPKIIIAPHYSATASVATAMQPIADRLRAVALIEGPNTTDQAAIDYRKQLGSKRLFLIDPGLKTWDSVKNADAVVPNSAYAAGLIARVDNELGFWWSPSNQLIYGITGLARPVDFVLGDNNSRANYLNENEVTTVIQQDGYRLWGNRTCSDDPKWAFINVVRTADILNDSLQREHLWAVDRCITKTYVADVQEGVNAYIRSLIAQGALLGGHCWPDPDLNSPANLAAGKVYWNFDFTPPAPAEHLTFQSILTNDYYATITGNAA